MLHEKTRIIGALAALIPWCVGLGQVSILNNTVVAPGAYIGCDGGSNQNLRFTTTLNFNHEWRTNNIWRMRLMGDNFAGNINGYPGLNLSGFLGLGTFNLLIPQPFTMLHMDNNGLNDAGYRPWMRTGTTLTQGSDLAYFGFKNEGADINHTVVTWSDNTPGVDGPDLLKFIFNRNNVGGTIAAGLNGLEAGRFFPSITGNEVFFGLGDWFTAGLNPTERFDMLNGRARIRQLPTDPVSLSTEFVTVNMTPGPNYGVLEHRPLTNLPDNCEWTMNAASPNHVWTAFGAADPACPDEDENVGIGDNGATYAGAKLAVVRKDRGTSGDMAIMAATEADGGTNYGIYSKCNMLSTSMAGQNAGLRAEARNGTTTYGLWTTAEVNTGGSTAVKVYGLSAASEATTTVHSLYGQRTDAGLSERASSLAVAGYFSLKLNNNAIIGSTGAPMFGYGVRAEAITAGSAALRARGLYGVHGTADAFNAGDAAYAFGVYGKANGGSSANYSIYGTYQTGTSGGTDFSGYFEGDIKANGVWYPSDDALKINEQPLQDAQVMVDQMEPLQYNYDGAAYPSLHLRSGTQLGLKAQALQDILPQLVRSAVQPEVVDSLGNILSPAVEYKVIDYVGLVPVLIAAVKEQRAEIQAMQQQLSTCCSDGTRMQQGTTIGYIDNALTPATQAADALAKDDLVVIPNPFQENPTISYRIGTTGRAQLRVSSSEGRDMGLLFDAGMQAGQHTLVWNTTGMAVGTYWLTLTLDGVRITEQAVKVQ